MKEDKKAFPYKPPSKKVQEKYKRIFTLTSPIGERPCKFIFDRLLSIILIFATLPFFIVILIAYFINGVIYPEDKGSIFAPYIAITRSRKFKKLKFRLVKECLIDNGKRKAGDYKAYPSERNPKNLTHIGKFLKRHYLDEFPQIFNVLKGDISFVGPRPLAFHHYRRDIRQGNVARKLIKAGIFSESHTRKGTPYFGKAELEYEYIEKYMTFPAFKLLWHDITIMARGIKMILEGKNY